MSLKFQIGDKVLILNDNLKGHIINIESSCLIIELQDSGLKTKTAFSNVMKLEDYNDMSNITYQKHNYSEKTQIIKDLHQDKIQKYNTSLNNSEVLRKQILIINDTIEKAFEINNENIEIIFIHGLGSGRLKSELHYILKEKNLDYKEVRGGVATKILI